MSEQLSLPTRPRLKHPERAGYHSCCILLVNWSHRSAFNMGANPGRVEHGTAFGEKLGLMFLSQV